MPRKLGCIASAFITVGLLGLFGWWLFSRPSPQVAAEKIKVYEQDPVHYAIKLPKGDWYDTGIWVSKDQLKQDGVVATTIATGPRQPFILRVGNHEIKASLVTFNQDASFQAIQSPSDDFSDQQKIYLKVDQEATANSLELNVEIGHAPKKPFAVWEGDIPGNSYWRDIGFLVKAGEVLSITASGQVKWINLPEGYDKFNTVGPNGIPAIPSTQTITVLTPADRDKFPSQIAQCGELIMKVKDHIYIVGSGTNMKVDNAGSVQFMINDNYVVDNTGSFHVVIKNLGREVQ